MTGQEAPVPEGAAHLTRLPVVYAVAIALHGAGVPEAAIAARLDLPRESIPALLEIAAAKLNRLQLEGLDEADPTTSAARETGASAPQTGGGKE